MRTKKEQIPIEFKNKYKSFDEFKLHRIEISKKYLEQAFDKLEINKKE